MNESPFADRSVREAVQTLRDAGVTPEQYATVELTETWSIGRVDYPDRKAAFAAARLQADESGEWAEVWLTWGPVLDGGWAAESWIVKPGEKAL